MDRIHNILNSVQNNLEAAQKTYQGKKRSELKDSDFLFPETRSFPIVTPQDIPDAISNFGRMKGNMSYDAFIHKLYNMAKRKGSEFVAAIPQATKDKLGIKATILPVPTVTVEPLDPNAVKPIIKPELVDEQQVNEQERLAKQKLEKIRVTDNGLMEGMTSDNPVIANTNFKIGDIVKNVNAGCKHYGSVGPVTDIEQLPDDAGDLIVYRTVNAGDHWSVGQTLKKTEVQLIKAGLISKDDVMMQSMPNREPSMELDQEYTSDLISQDQETENETPEVEMNEYKQEFLEMSIASLRAIAKHAMGILDNLDNPNINENLTESWLQGRIAVTEDYMRTIHDFVMFSESEADNNSEAGSKPGLWDNIRKKREREGKKYRPAKPGDKDRPDPEQWKKLTK
jgi:hypothetical protein